MFFELGKFLLKKILILCVLLLAINACDKRSSPENTAEVPLPPAPEKNTITFVTLNSPNTYYVDSDKQFAGLEYDLALLFSEYLGENTHVKFIVADSIEKVIANLINHEADIAASDLTITDERKALIDFSEPYQDVQEQVVYNRETNDNPPKNIKELANAHVVVPAATSFVERLVKLKKSEPNLMWEERNDVHSEKLLEEVAAGDINYTIADNHLVSVLQNYLPNLGVAFSLGNSEKIAWGFPKKQQTGIKGKSQCFLQKD